MLLRFAALSLAAVPLLLVALALGAHPADAGDIHVPWGDADCSGGIDPVDSLKLLRSNAGLSVAKADPDCPDIGDEARVLAVDRTWGDVDCSSAADPIDSLKTLRFDAGLSVAKVDQTCPDAGDVVGVSPPGGAEIVFDGSVPSAIDGEPLSVDHSGGAELAAGDDQWTDYFSQLGVSPADFTASSSSPPQDSGLDLTVVALSASGDDWPAKLAAFVAAIQASSGPLAVEAVSPNGVQLAHVTSTLIPEISVYYYASGDTIWMIDTHDEELAGRISAGLPGTAGAELPAALPEGEAPPPGQGVLAPMLLRQPLAPVCVAEPFGRQQLMFLVLDAGWQVPVPAFMSPLSFTAGEVSPFSDYGAPTFNYRATGYSPPEQIQMQAAVPGGGSGVSFTTFPVQHCLNGNWLDGDRLVEVTQTGNSVTTLIIAGPDEGTSDFSGTLSGDVLTGSDLQVSNPDECVDAGLLDAKAFVPYTATISFDGNSADFEWEGAFYDFVYDDDDNLIACNQTSTEQHFFSITRQTFGPGVP